jgi:hypothetical protein
MCEHCDAMERVLIELTGRQVASVIMKKVQERIHGESKAKDEKGNLESEIVSLESTRAHLRSGLT